MPPHGPTARKGQRTTPWLVAALAAAGLAGLATSALAGDWTRYTNDRFGASAEVPATGFAIEPPPTNGDGRGWKSSDGKGEISVYGSFTGEAETFDDYRQQLLGFAADDGIAVTYQAGKKNQWFVYSGTVDGDIIYLKAVRAEPCSTLVVNHIHFRYPAAQKTRYDPIVAHGAKSLGTEPAIECE